MTPIQAGETVINKDNANLFFQESGMFRKKVPIRAVRMSGPFTVQTSEGTLTCQDGWLCKDARGYPYPVADDEFQLIYEPQQDET